MYFTRGQSGHRLCIFFTNTGRIFCHQLTKKNHTALSLLHLVCLGIGILGNDWVDRKANRSLLLLEIMCQSRSLDKALFCHWSNVSYWVQNPTMEQPQNITQSPFVMQQQSNNLPSRFQEHKLNISKCEGTTSCEGQMLCRRTNAFLHGCSL